MKKKIILFVISLFLLNCSNMYGKNDVTILSLPEKAEKDSVFFNNFELQAIIPLETVPQSILNRIDRIIIKDDYMLIQSKGVYIFDREGKFIRQIGCPGNGPGEYHQIIDVAIDNDNNIVIFSDDYKLIYYSKDGKYLRQERLKDIKLFHDMQFINNELYVYSGTKYSDDEKLIKKYSNNTFSDCGDIIVADFLGPRHVYTFGERFVKSKSILFSQNTENIIYELKNGLPIKRYQINSPKFITKKQIKELAQKGKNQDVAGYMFSSQTVLCFTSIRETKDGVFCETNLDSFIWIEPNGKCHKFRGIFNDKISYAGLRYFAHDGDDDLLVFIATPESIAQRKKGDPNHPTEKILQTVKEDDNPVLLFFRRKKG